MESAREPAAGSPDGTRERLAALERRVEALEHSAERDQHKRGRWRLYALVTVALYLVVVWWELNTLG